MTQKYYFKVNNTNKRCKIRRSSPCPKRSDEHFYTSWSHVSSKEWDRRPEAHGAQLHVGGGAKPTSVFRANLPVGHLHL
jgi:hypothetical protein